ncbi:MAG: T9SS type A sorting domain-containing protein [Chitinophagales bacterium]
MRKNNLFSALVVFLFLSLTAQAQINTDLEPKSFSLAKKFFAAPPSVALPALNITDAERLDKIDVKNGELPKFSRSIYTNLTLDNSGSWSEMPDGGRVWRLRLSSSGALALIPYFNQFFIPEGAYLHVYMPGKEEVLGAFTSENNPANGYYTTGLLHGDVAIFEYYEPAYARGKGALSINEVGYAYRWVRALYNDGREFGDASSCEVNVACSEGTPYADQVRSVVRILVNSSQGQGWCSGAMVNNTLQDCTPYLLSAQHCSEGTTASQYSQWVFYFNYQSPTCSDPASEGSLGNKTVIGCTKVADSRDGGGDKGSDFLLLQLNKQPSAAYNVYYSGWNNQNIAPASGVCIHHPSGDIKKISAYSAAPSSATWGGSVADTHWEVHWVATTNGYGVTEAGSSGSPLFNSAGEIVGTLTGGGSFCNTPNQPDDFGKVAKDWTSNGVSASVQLKPWLDPSNSGTVNLLGINAPCGTLPTLDAGIRNIKSPVSALCDSFVPVVVLRNYGSASLTTAVINYTIDGNVYQKNWSGNVTSGSSVSVSLPAVSGLSPGPHQLVASAENPNNGTDGNTANDGSTQNFTIPSSDGTMNLTFVTDKSAADNVWEVVDASGFVVATGGPYTSGSSQTIHKSICLSDGCYTLVVYDEMGNGMKSGATGQLTLTGANTGTTYATISGTGSWYKKEASFCVSTTGIMEQTPLQIAVFPNPTTGELQLTFADSDSKTINITNALGQVMLSTTCTQLNCSINLGGAAKGVYFVAVDSANGKAVKKVILE